MSAALIEQFDLLAASTGGIAKLRELILSLAVRGQLVPQDSKDEPASELLKKIRAEKDRLIAEGKIKRDKPLAEIGEDEKPFELPAGWEWVRLGAITNFGATTKVEEMQDDTWVLDLEDIEKDTSRLLRKIRFAERQALSDKNCFERGDVLYGKLRPYLNKVIVADEPGVCTTEILPVRCHGPFDPHYFRAVLKSPMFLEYVNSKSYGMKMPRLGTEDGRSALFPLAPLAEQSRIVAKVEELMALCDRLEAEQGRATRVQGHWVETALSQLAESADAEAFQYHWQHLAEHWDQLFTTPESIAKLEATLLQLAVRGKLVAQDPSDQPASELLKQIRAEKDRLIAEGKIKRLPAGRQATDITDDEKPYALPEGWEWVRMADLCRPISSGSTPAADCFSDISGIPYLKVYNIRNQAIDFEYKKQFISDDLHRSKLSRSILYPGDVVMNIVGPPLGKIAIIPDNYPEWNCNQAIAFFGLIRPISAQYIWTYLCEKSFLDNIELIGTAGQDNISVTKSQNILVPVPPLAEQSRIVAQVEALLALTAELKARLRAAQTKQAQLAEVLIAEVC